MSLRGISITEGKIGANVAGDSREFGLLCNGLALQDADKAQLDTLYKLRRVSDAEAIGITADYDTDNNVRVYRHITEFYRRAGEGRILHLWLVAQTVTPQNITAQAQQMIVAAGGEISDLAVAINPAADYAGTQIDGLNSDIKAAISVMQQLAEWADAHDMPLHIILEGRGISDNVASLADLRDLQNSGQPLQAQKVTLAIGQDWTYADTLDDLGKKFADVGTFLGCIASQAWNRNPGEVATQNLTNAIQGIWLLGGLSNHKKYYEVFDTLETLKVILKMSKEKVTTLPEGITAEMVAQAKQQHGENNVRIIDLPKNEEETEYLSVLACVPSRNVIGQYMKWGDNDPKRAHDILVKNCLLSSKEQVLADDYLFFAALNAIATLIPARTGIVKNV